MEINSPPFNEKQFLLCLLSVLQSQFGHERRFIFEHKFSSIDTDMLEYIPDLMQHSKHVAIKKYISQWFHEAAVRGFVQNVSNHYYKITEAGLNSALKYRHPIRTFWVNHWKWLVPFIRQ